MAENVVPICSQEEAFHILDQLLLILNFDSLIDEVGFIHPSLLLMLKEEEDRLPHSSRSRELDESEISGLNDSVALKANPAFFWSREHKLGISTAYLLPLYRAAKSRFMDAYENYKMHATEEHVEVKNELMKHSTALVLLSSDFGTAWNARKHIISKRDDFSITEELHLSALVLSFAPKSENAWSYRRWVIRQVAGRCVTAASLEDILENESKIVETIAEVLFQLQNWLLLSIYHEMQYMNYYRNFVEEELDSGSMPSRDVYTLIFVLTSQKSKMNYRAWNHRCWLIPFMTSQQVLHELKINRSWATSHVADSSCFYYRRKLMLQMLSDGSSKRNGKECSYEFESLQQLWKDELDWNESLIRRYIGREALWLHRRFLSVCWAKHFGADQRGSSLHSTAEGIDDTHLSDFIDNEVGLLQDSLGLSDSMFDDVQSQITHSASYILWLDREICRPSNIILDKKLGADNLRTLLHKLCPEKTEVWNSLLN